MYADQIDTHHMVDDEPTLLDLFEQFRMKFPYTNVHVDEQFMVYGIRHRSCAESILKEALKVIDANGLPLIGYLNKDRVGVTLVIKARQ